MDGLGSTFCILFSWSTNDKKNHDDNECNASLWQYWVFSFSFVSRPTSIELPRPHLPPVSQGFICSFQFSTWCCYYWYVWYAVAFICSIAAKIFDMLLLLICLIYFCCFDVWLYSYFDLLILFWCLMLLLCLSYLGFSFSTKDFETSTRLSSKDGLSAYIKFVWSF